MCLLLVVLIPAAAFAENFSIRNGITFGMTFEETQKIDQIEEEKYSFGEKLGDYYLGIHEGRLEDGSVAYCFSDKIAGNSVEVYYTFDSGDNGLNSIIYDNRNYCYDYSDYKSKYEDIIESNDKSLQNRYANDSYGKYEELRSSTFKQIVKAAYESPSKMIKDCDIEYNQFLVPYDDYYVEIEHLIIMYTLGGEFAGVSQDGAYNLQEYIIYTRVDKEKASASIMDKVAEQMEVENSKKNDF